MKKLISAVLMSAFLAVLAACSSGGGGASPAPETLTPAVTSTGTSVGAATSMTIGAAGGTISTPDGKITISIPAGALDADTVISIQPITNMAHGGLGSGYRLTPDGQTFLKPVTLVFAYTDQDLAGTAPEVLGAAFQTVAAFWQWLGEPTLDSVAKTVSVDTTHFTDASMVQGYRLQPLSKTIKVNETAALRVAFCYPPPVNAGDDLHPLGLKCDTSDSQGSVAAPFVISEWSVNGVAGGSGAAGTVSGSGPSATYTAPATKPSPNTVAVSARVDMGTKGKMLVVSNITIDDQPPAYTGSVTFNYRISADLSVTGTATVAWTLFEDLGDTRRYLPSGTVTADIVATNCDSLHTTFPLNTSTPSVPMETMVVYTATNSAFPKTYTFWLAGSESATVTMSCGTPRAPVQLPASTLFQLPVGICTSMADLPTFVDETQLMGSWSCVDSGVISADWFFSPQ